MKRFGGAAPQQQSQWEAAWSEDHERWFYYDRSTGLSQWKRPPDCSLPLPVYQPPKGSYITMWSASCVTPRGGVCAALDSEIDELQMQLGEARTVFKHDTKEKKQLKMELGDARAALDQETQAKHELQMQLGEARTRLAHETEVKNQLKMQLGQARTAFEHETEEKKQLKMELGDARAALDQETQAKHKLEMQLCEARSALDHETQEKDKIHRQLLIELIETRTAIDHDRQAKDQLQVQLGEATTSLELETQAKDELQQQLGEVRASLDQEKVAHDQVREQLVEIRTTVNYERQQKDKLQQQLGGACISLDRERQHKDQLQQKLIDITKENERLWWTSWLPKVHHEEVASRQSDDIMSENGSWILLTSGGSDVQECSAISAGSSSEHCFMHGQLFKTATDEGTGFLSTGNLREGSEVLAADGKTPLKVVGAPKSYKTCRIVELCADGAALAVTRDHRIAMQDSYESARREVKAIELKPGNFVIVGDRPVELSSVREITDKEVEVFKITFKPDLLVGVFAQPEEGIASYGSKKKPFRRGGGANRASETVSPEHDD